MTEAIIQTSRSQYITSLDCPRKVWLGYHYPKSLTGGAVDGLERKRLSTALTVGSAVHHGLVNLLGANALALAVRGAISWYDNQIGPRQLDAEVENDSSYVVNEQRALIAALLRAWYRVRRAALLNEYDVIDLEREESVMLAPDVQFQARADAMLRRKADGSIFILSFKTSSEARWLMKHENDMQTISEVVAADARLGVPIAGVLIEGLLKGRRVPIDTEGREVRDNNAPIARVIQRSPLIYGYKYDGNPPLEPAAYDYASTRKKGWRRFPVWEANDFGAEPLSYWVNWLPEEIVAAQLVTLPPVLRTERVIEAWKRQITERTRNDYAAALVGVHSYPECDTETIDRLFPQNDAACNRFGSKTSRCQFWDACWTANVGQDPIASGLYVARTPNHPRGETNV